MINTAIEAAKSAGKILVTDFEGKPISLDSKSFLATNKINHEKILELLK